ncbi:sugar phosphate isomerase/epimerase family protein [Prosthecomicrobium pneumaticum]|uniref:Sugar phosphate isomerase/epimerase n=1 Tax=Prosthecomicrobium pneumaticum TaxID=81895 RepID=A0A7W9CU28_9HYPH|nr:sugar phosphate isomerase/epimerase [Prosthecomicrobium pneumaticum]MBB5751578.1 sugar phosphate isomerase/epimerase [Prosthecomicrobium pneumaticum]
MRVGIFAKTFPGSDPETVLSAAKAAGYDCVQFNMSCAGLASLPEAIPDEALAAIRLASRRTGVAIAALSATYNMIHPDPVVRTSGLARLGGMLAAAADLGVPLVTLCTGTRDAADMWRHHPDNATPEAWSDLLAEMEKASALAERHGVALGIEPEQANVVTSAADALRLIGAIGSPAIRIVLDPANLFERATPAEARAIVAAAVDALGPHIALAHAKDRAADGAFVTAGTGVVDFPDLIARLGAAGFDGPLVTHGLSAEEAPGVASFLRGLVRQ